MKLLITGKMPITKELPYSWYETPNIHFFTLKDFEEVCKSSKINIEKSIGLSSNGKQFNILNNSQFSNLFANEAIFLLTKRNFETIKIKSTKQKITSSTVTAN